MNRIADINNIIEVHLLLSDVEITTDGFSLGFNECMNMNMSKYKRLAIRKIKCEMVEDPGYLFYLYVTYYNIVNGDNNLYITNIQINHTTETTIDIGNKIVSHLNDYLESKDIPHIFRTYISYWNIIRIQWYNAGDSNDDFEFMLFNEYTSEHFELDGGADSVNSYAKKLDKNNAGLYLLPWGNDNGVHDSYQPIGNYDLSNLFFHWDVMESDTYVYEIESASTNNKSGDVCMKEYGLNDVKLFRLNEGNQHCKIWFTKD
jgi:hypothetical protein